MELGELLRTLVSDGEFRLDGVGTLGVVPRTLWEQAKPPDSLNRIRMGTNCLLVERGSELLLIDTGIGEKHDARFQEIYAMAPRGRAAAGGDPPRGLRAGGRHPRRALPSPLRPLRLEHPRAARTALTPGIGSASSPNSSTAPASNSGSQFCGK